MSDVLFERVGGLGRVVLNRPKAINALNHEMVSAVAEALHGWAADPSVGAVVLTGAGERGFCAGGDLVAMHRDALVQGTATRDFWRDEYRLNALVARYPKPVVAIMDGIVMGGGIGLAGHASHRIVTERTRAAMPEVGIGLVPDVGGTWLLARAPGELGTHAALTAAHLGPGEAIAAGLADRYVESGRIPELLAALAALSLSPADAAPAVEARIAEVAGAAPAVPTRTWIDGCFAADTVEEILARLRAAGEPEAEQAAKEIEQKSPTCVTVTLAALRRARGLSSLEEALNQEFRVSQRCLAAPDLAEGIRAQVIDKDRRPRWTPATLDGVTDVSSYFAPLAAELGL